MHTAFPLLKRSANLAAHFIKRLRETPLLSGWLLIGLLITLLQDGWAGLGLGLVNLCLLGLYILLIRRMTPNVPEPLPVKHPRLELAIALFLFTLVLMVQFLDFGVWTAQPWQGWVHGFFVRVKQWTNAWGLPVWAQSGLFSAISSSIKQLIPTLLVFILFGWGRQAMGVARLHVRLTAVLVGITAVLGLITGVLMRAPPGPGQVLGIYGIGIFINSLPEELFFRGLLLPRLEKAIVNPLNALVVSALLFNAIHVPLELSQGEPLLTALAGIFRTDYPTGLLWGYLYLRTRSIAPGVFWHAANGRLGFLFMDFQ